MQSYARVIRIIVLSSQFWQLIANNKSRHLHAQNMFMSRKFPRVFQEHIILNAEFVHKDVAVLRHTGAFMKHFITIIIYLQNMSRLRTEDGDICVMKPSDIYLWQ